MAGVGDPFSILGVRINPKASGSTPVVAVEDSSSSSESENWGKWRPVAPKQSPAPTHQSPQQATMEGRIAELRGFQNVASQRRQALVDQTVATIVVSKPSRTPKRFSPALYYCTVIQTWRFDFSIIIGFPF